MSAILRPRRVIGTMLALVLGYGLWRLSDVVVDLLQWPDLLPLVRLGAVVVGVTCLEFVFAALRPLLRETRAQALTAGEHE